MGKCAKIIRTVTVAPIMAGVMLIILFCFKPQILGNTANFVCGILFLTILPILAYPLQKWIPRYRDRGREGQRSLAMLFAVCGYIGGSIVNLFMNAPVSMWILYLEYLISGLVILLFNKCFHLRASGHACGVAGPVALLVYFGIPALIGGLVLLTATWWASLQMMRHTVWQLAGGTAIPLAVICLLGGITYLL